MGKRRRRRDKETGEHTTPSTAKAPYLSPSSPPAPLASQEMIQAEEQNASLGLLDLPETVILQIFSYLPVSDLVPRVRRTCKRLHELSRSSCLWANQTFKYEANRNGPLKDDYLSFYISLLRQTCIVSHYRNCKGDGGDGDTTVPGTGDCTQQQVEDCVQNMVTSLTEICVDRTKVKSHSIVSQRLVYPRLQRLVLKVSSLPSTVFLNQHSKLRSLTIHCVHSKGCANNIIDLFNHLELKSCSNLRNLHMQIDKWEEPLDSVKTMWVAMKDYFRTGPALTRLRLDVPVNDDIVTTILEGCENLEDLQLSNGHLTRRVFKDTLKYPNVFLTALRLMDCALNDASMVYAIAQSFRHLKHLELSSSFTLEWNEALEMLQSPKLELSVLKVNVMVSLSDIQKSIQKENGVNGAHEPLPKVTCPAVPTEPEKGRLEELVFKGSCDLSLSLHRCNQPHLRSLVAWKPLRHPDDNDVIAISSLQSLVQTCPQLQHVNLRGYRMPPSGLELLRALPRLVSFRCFVCQFQGHQERPEPPANMEGVKETLRHLELNFHYTPGKELGTLCAYFPGVTSLTIIQHRFVVRNFDLKVIARGLPCLDTFVIEQGYYEKNTRINSLTYQAMHHLLTLCRRLRSVKWLVPILAFRESFACALVHHPTLCDLAMYDLSKKSFDCDWFVREIEREIEEEMCRINVENPSGLITNKYIPTQVKLKNNEMYVLFEILCFSLRRWREATHVLE